MAHPSKATVQNLHKLFERVTNEMTDHEILEDLKHNPDPTFNAELNQIKQMRAAALVKAKREKFSRALTMLKEYLAKEENVLLPGGKYQQAQVLYRKYQHSTPDDDKQLVIDKMLLEFIAELDNDDV